MKDTNQGFLLADLLVYIIPYISLDKTPFQKLRKFCHASII